MPFKPDDPREAYFWVPKAALAPYPGNASRPYFKGQPVLARYYCTYNESRYTYA